MPLTKLNNKSVANVTSIPVALGDMVFISSATASSSASIEFTQEFRFNLSTDNGSNYNVVKTTTTFTASQDESGGNTGLAYASGSDLAQGTGDQAISVVTGNDNDACTSGYLHLFNPSSTTFVKHFLAQSSTYRSDIQMNYNWFTGGYANTTSALTNIKFNFASGNIDDGKILMFGIN
jgi:hypothetical protein